MEICFMDSILNELKQSIKKHRRWISSFLVSLLLHILVIFPYIPQQKYDIEPQLMQMTEVRLYNKPPPKKKIKKKIIKKKKPKPKPKHVEKPPEPKKEEPEPDPVPTEAYEVKGNPKPIYPNIAIQRGWQGICILQLQILEDGTVGKISLLKTTGRKLLDQSAIRAVKYWKFKPATKKGKVVKSKLKVPIEFILTDR